MTEFFNFAENNPVLTFFLFSIVSECIVKIIYAIKDKKVEEE